MIIYSQDKLSTLTIDETRPLEISWTCIGSVSIKKAEDFAHNILALCEQAKTAPQESPVPPYIPKPTKKKLIKVIFKRAEGPTIECVEKEFTSLAEAQVQATRWSQTAPPEGKGYDKCDFTLVFEDGNTYKGRYDLHNTGYNSSGERIFEQVVGHLSYVAGKHRPAGMTDKNWQFECEDHIRTGQAQAAREFLEAYEIS